MFGTSRNKNLIFSNPPLQIIQRFPGFADELVYLLFADDERRGDDHGVAHRTHDEAVGEAEVAT